MILGLAANGTKFPGNSGPCLVTERTNVHKDWTWKQTSDCYWAKTLPVAADEVANPLYMTMICTFDGVTIHIYIHGHETVLVRNICNDSMTVKHNTTRVSTRINPLYSLAHGHKDYNYIDITILLAGTMAEGRMLIAGDVAPSIGFWSLWLRRQGLQAGVRWADR